VGSNTETSDDCRRRQFSIGKLSVRKLPFSNPTIADENGESSGQKGEKGEKSP
jgi:hypothetical protein